MRLLLWKILFVIAVGNDMIHAHRAKRLVAFKKGSTFFARLNYKIASVPWTTIFAQATGFKAAWHLPDGTRTQRSIDDIHSTTALMYESHGLNGAACLASNICELFKKSNNKNGVIGKIIKLLSGASNTNWTHAEDYPLLNCEQHRTLCPLQLIGVDGFTEA
ncbi:hypothetical protein HCN44_009305 [Aphidius gifuensis]|uniref:Odorant-binding protein n=1 Tax=Aphidius gifuensis TaxID=684658 RepID=A0A835CVX2_APHGI|nr:uncharacterized protein LOC122859365 [Aphidius gifuensis]KAF7997907.1 hypothetical protein HCN44_009305 [Aphidius gifuensis]